MPVAIATIFCTQSLRERAAHDITLASPCQACFSQTSIEDKLRGHVLKSFCFFSFELSSPRNQTYAQYNGDRGCKKHGENVSSKSCGALIRVCSCSLPICGHFFSTELSLLVTKIAKKTTKFVGTCVHIILPLLFAKTPTRKIFFTY